MLMKKIKEQIVGDRRRMNDGILKTIFLLFLCNMRGKREEKERERESVRESCVSSSLVLEPERVDYLVEFIYGSTKTKTTFY